MLRLTAEPIDTAALRAELASPAGGALVVFEGWVRHENNGRTVTRLDYEGAEALAANEYERILAEARQRFDIIDARCAHRVGVLQVGEVAVWVGVVAGHRGDAFDAGRYLIDEIKKRLPIWKKEHYAEGDSGWINAP